MWGMQKGTDSQFDYLINRVGSIDKGEFYIVKYIVKKEIII